MVNSHVFGICILEHKRGFVSDSDYRSAVLSNMQSAKTYYNADMNQTEKKILRRKLITGTLTFCALLIGLYFLVDWLNLSIDDIIHYTPQNKILAGLVFMLFYALKSVTVFFPLPLIQLAVGHLFSSGGALFVNFCGIAVSITIPYLIGYKKGEKYVTALVNQVDTIEKIKSMQSGSAVFSTYMIRMLQLPLDLVSMFLGAEHIRFSSYFLGSMLGLAPVTIAVTLIGETITKPGSREFWYSILFIAVLIGISLLIFWRYTKRKRKKTGENK